MPDPDPHEAAPEPAAEPVPDAASEASPEPTVGPTPAESAEMAVPAAAAAEPAKVYELPTARKVVSSGLVLSLASSSELRRASIYIGVLILAAFGPAALAVLMTLGRLGEGAGDVLGTLLFSPEVLAETQPEVGGVLLVLMFVLIGGLVSYIAITVDAGIIAIAILGGRAADKPVRLWEAIVRARQSFWRIAGAGFLVGLIAGIVQLAVTAAVALFSQSQETSSVITAIVSTLAVAPFAYVSAGIVLGDVGAVESLSRSWRLFRVRPWLAVIVVLFTLVTSAIQLFALSAGLDLILRASDALHVSVTEGAIPFLAATVLMLAAITAFGSLLFTIGAIVSAPQVTGFLGLTFFSGGLDKARSPEPKPPKGFRWITRPMLALVVGTTAVIGLEIPAINSIEPAPIATMLSTLIAIGDPNQQDVFAYGAPAEVRDPGGDPAVVSSDMDVVLGEPGYIFDVPSWFLNTAFDCARPDVGCAEGGSYPATFYSEGALVFIERLAGGPSPSPAGKRVWGVLLELDGVDAVPLLRGNRFPGATHMFLTAWVDGRWRMQATDFETGSYRSGPTDARSRWIGADLVTLIPIRELDRFVNRWDLYASGPNGAIDERSGDFLRGNSLDPMIFFEEPAEYEFEPR